ncbi:MAG TPA: oligosaccharide flippase family protein [Gaiellaceae bacterium]|nr:oligosaccharide flippase family protein [Gaiellaceae bacterium]
MSEQERGQPESSPGTALLFWAQIVGNSGLFVGLLLVTRALGPSGRGTVAFLTVTALVTAWIARLGVTEATVVFAARRPELRPTLLTNSLTFSTLAGLAGASVVCGTLWLVPALRPRGVGAVELGVLAVSILAACLADAGYRFMLGCSRFRTHALVTAVTSWIYPLLAVVLWALFGLTVALATAVWAATQALRAVSLFSVAIRREGGLGRPSLGLLHETISFGLRAWLGTLADSLGFRIDQILLALIASEAALGFYVVAVNLSEILLYFPGAVSTALLPLAARSEAGPRLGQTLRAYRSATYVTLASIVLSALIVPPLIPLVFGASFHASAIPFLLLLPGLIGFTAMIVFCNALIASSLPALSSIPPAVCFVVGIALDFALIPFFQASGAAAAASAGYCAAGVCAVLIYRAHAPFRLLELVVPQSGDFAVLRTLAPRPRAPLARRGAH